MPGGSESGGLAEMVVRGFFWGGGMDIVVLPYETRAAFDQIRVCLGNPALVPSSLRSLFAFHHHYDTARTADQ